MGVSTSIKLLASLLATGEIFFFSEFLVLTAPLPVGKSGKPVVVCYKIINLGDTKPLECGQCPCRWQGHDLPLIVVAQKVEMALQRQNEGNNRR